MRILLGFGHSLESTSMILPSIGGPLKNHVGCVIGEAGVKVPGSGVNFIGDVAVGPSGVRTQTQAGSTTAISGKAGLNTFMLPVPRAIMIGPGCAPGTTGPSLAMITSSLALRTCRGIETSPFMMIAQMLFGLLPKPPPMMVIIVPLPPSLGKKLSMCGASAAGMMVTGPAGMMAVWLSTTSVPLGLAPLVPMSGPALASACCNCDKVAPGASCTTMMILIGWPGSMLLEMAPRKPPQLPPASAAKPWPVLAFAPNGPKPINGTGSGRPGMTCTTSTDFTATMGPTRFSAQPQNIPGPAPKVA